MTDFLKRTYYKWVTERENCKHGGGQYFERAKVRAARAEKTASFPRKVAHQHEVDLEHERYLQTIDVHDPRSERLFTHYVKATTESRRERMRVYKANHRPARVKPLINAAMVGRQERYIVEGNAAAGIADDEVVVCDMPEGITYGQYRTGDSVTFTIRDTNYRGKLVVQLLPHVGIREAERETWRLNQNMSNLGKLVWQKDGVNVVWRSAPFQLSRNSRSSTTRARVVEAVCSQLRSPKA